MPARVFVLWGRAGLGVILLFCTLPLFAATYTIKPGDTIPSLARQFAVTSEALITLNHISDPDMLFVGQQLQLPDNAVLPKLSAAGKHRPAASHPKAPVGTATPVYPSCVTVTPSKSLLLSSLVKMPAAPGHPLASALPNTAMPSPVPPVSAVIAGSPSVTPASSAPSLPDIAIPAARQAAMRPRPETTAPLCPHVAAQSPPVTATVTASPPSGQRLTTTTPPVLYGPPAPAALIPAATIPARPFVQPQPVVTAAAPVKTALPGLPTCTPPDRPLPMTLSQAIAALRPKPAIVEVVLPVRTSVTTTKPSGTSTTVTVPPVLYGPPAPVAPADSTKPPTPFVEPEPVVIARAPAAMAAPRQPTYTALTRPLPALPPHPKPKPAVVEEAPPDEESVPIEIVERPLTRSEAVQQEEEVAALRRSPLGVRTVAIARMFAGTRYRRGGLSARGMDCSGLVVRVMQMEGLNVPHHAATLYHLGTPIRTSSLQPGDLLFFRGSAHGGISHVAIWVGDNRFIHASSSNRGVTVDTLSGYYAKHFAGARRLKR